MGSDSRSTRALADNVAGECLGARARILSRVLTRIHDAALRDLGIRFSQLNILTVVVLRGPIRPGEIVQMLALEKSTVSRNVKVLEANGWLRSRPGDGGNARHLEITAAGERLYREAVEAWERAQEETVARLGRKAALTLRGSVDRIRDEETMS